MASTPCTEILNSTSFCKNRSMSHVASSAFQLQEPRCVSGQSMWKGRKFIRQEKVVPLVKITSKKSILTTPRCSNSSNFSDKSDESSDQEKALHDAYILYYQLLSISSFVFSRMITPFGYTRKDVLLIGLGVTFLGIGLKSGLEFVGVDPLQAGNVVQLVLVLGLTVGWISTYIFRVSNKEMTYAQQLRDYEYKVMEKRLESLTEAEIQALLEQVEEEKERLAGGEQVK